MDVDKATRVLMLLLIIRYPFGYVQEFYERVLNLVNDYNAELYHELALAFECAVLTLIAGVRRHSGANALVFWVPNAHSLSCRYAWHMIFGEPPVLVAMPECDLLTCDGAAAH
jgi:hypothetical protein